MRLRNVFTQRRSDGQLGVWQRYHPRFLALQCDAYQADSYWSEHSSELIYSDEDARHESLAGNGAVICGHYTLQLLSVKQRALRSPPHCLITSM